MVRVTFIVEGEATSVECDTSTGPCQRHGRPGSLLDIALGHGIALEHACGGNGACTTCHVVIRSGSEHLSPMADTEADRLDSAWGVTPASRLACQAVVTGDVVCEVPAYTRNAVTEDGRIQLGRLSARQQAQEKRQP